MPELLHVQPNLMLPAGLEPQLDRATRREAFAHRGSASPRHAAASSSLAQSAAAR